MDSDNTMADTVLARLGGKNVADAIARAATVCVATQRLAHALRSAWSEHMHAEGVQVWRTPDILPLTAWQRRLTERSATMDPGACSDVPANLEQQQELIVWEQAAASAGVLDDVLQPRAIASAMMEAHALATGWAVHPDPATVPEGSDVAAFLTVREHAEKRWQQLVALPAAMLPWRAIDVIRSQPHLLPREMVFLGFDLPKDAALRQTLTALTEAGVRVQLPPPAHAAGRTRLLRFPSFEDELHDAARDCRERLSRGESEIGIIIPDLTHVRDEVEQVFSGVLHAELRGREYDDERPLFELSLGPRAIDEGLIAAAFLLLEVLRPALPLETWTRILHSPFTQAADRFGDSRVLLDARLRKRGREKETVAELRAMAGTGADRDEDPLLHALRKLPRDAKRTPGAWVEVFLDVLHAFGWPGVHTLSSREFQARERFRELLQEFGDLDAVLGPVPLNEALRRFRLLASERIFQVQSTGAPVQIMGVRESTGLRFTHCRVLGMNDEVWPPRPHSTAFLPVTLQRRAGLPAADPELYLAQMREQTTSLMRLAGEVIFTCAATDGDRELLPSVLLDALTVEEHAAIRADTIHLRAGRDLQELNAREEPFAPAIGAEGLLRGGSGIITMQAACPFRAFAEYRLIASRPEDLAHGLRALDRGNLVHSALDHLWKMLGGSAALQTLSEGERRETIGKAVDAAFENERTVQGRCVADHVLEAERACLLILLDEWLRAEEQRAPFDVEGREVKTEIELAGLRLQLKVDRIDRLPDGSTALIDYKTGCKSAKAWLPPRPEEPQLPMYLQAMGADVRALAYAIVRRGKCRYEGVREAEAAFGELTDAGEFLAKQGYAHAEWSVLLEDWRNALRELAEEILSGYAVVRPRDGEQTCRWCPLPSLCRIDDARFGVEGAAGESDDDNDGDTFVRRAGKEGAHGNA